MQKLDYVVGIEDCFFPRQVMTNSYTHLIELGVIPIFDHNIVKSCHNTCLFDLHNKPYHITGVQLDIRIAWKLGQSL